MANTIYIYKRQLDNTTAKISLQDLIGGSIINCESTEKEYFSIEIDSSKKDDLDEILSDKGYVYIGIGSVLFNTANNLGTTLSSTPPTSIASIGSYFYASDLNKPLWYDGSNWRDADGVIII